MKVNPNINQIVTLPDGRRIPKELADIAAGMESQFYNLLFEQMEKSIDHAEDQSSAEEYYSSLMRQDRIDAMTKNNQGKGLQKVIIDKFAPPVNNQRIKSLNSNPYHVGKLEK